MLQVNPGTQAARTAVRHPFLQPGSVLRVVQDTDVSALPYKQVIGVIKAHTSRPLVLRFRGVDVSGGGEPARRDAARATDLSEGLIGQSGGSEASAESWLRERYDHPLSSWSLMGS